MRISPQNLAVRRTATALGQHKQQQKHLLHTKQPGAAPPQRRRARRAHSIWQTRWLDVTRARTYRVCVCPIPQTTPCAHSNYTGDEPARAQRTALRYRMRALKRDSINAGAAVRAGRGALRLTFALRSRVCASAAHTTAVRLAPAPSSAQSRLQWRRAACSMGGWCGRRAAREERPAPHAHCTGHGWLVSLAPHNHCPNKRKVASGDAQRVRAHPTGTPPAPLQQLCARVLCQGSAHTMH